MITILTLILVTLFLAYSNGANDNFKGVATLFGSDTTDYKKALRWATTTTFAGSVCSIFLAGELVKSFSGKGVVPDMLAGTPEFLIPVAIGAGFTVFLASITGFPISTTHGLTGALVGAGLMAVGRDVGFSILAKKFLVPLLVSPVLAVVFGGLLYAFLTRLRQRMGISKETCVCVSEPEPAVAVAAETSLFRTAGLPSVTVSAQEVCEYRGSLLGISAQKLLDSLHFFSAGIVSFARGLNDTPKIVAILVVLQAFRIEWEMLLVATAMAIGGLLNARKVAETMSKKITPLNHGQGFTANLVTGILVVFASRLGVPVSTTHVSVGSIFGLGLVTKGGDKNVIQKILSSWVLTLPIAGIASALTYFLLN